MEASKEFDGPTTPTAEQLPAVVELANRVFRSGRSGDMGREYPTLFRPDGLEQMRIVLHKGRPVSHVGVVLGDVSLLGCSTRVASIGAVCTDEAFRGRGLGGTLMDDAVRHACKQGAAVMLISGGRSLYTRRGAYSVGAFARYTFAADALPTMDGLSLDPVTADGVAIAGEALRLFEGEPIRYHRDIEDYRTQLGSRNLVNRPGETVLVRRGGRPSAVLSVNLPLCVPQQKDVLIVQELAGSRPDVLAAAGALTARNHAASLQVEAYAQDLTLASLAAEAGAKAHSTAFPGTVKILDVATLWQDFWPLLAERIGPATARSIDVSFQADDFGVQSVEIRRGSEAVKIEGAKEALSAFFDPSDTSPLATAQGPLAELLRQALPLPLPMYGLNYV